MTSISVHLANTRSGEYDVRFPLPKPLHCDAVSGRIVRGGGDVDQVVGFCSDPDEFEADLTWQEWTGGDPFDLGAVVGLFPVVSVEGELATLTVPVTGVSVSVPDPGAVVAE